MLEVTYRAFDVGFNVMSLHPRVASIKNHGRSGKAIYGSKNFFAITKMHQISSAYVSL